MTGSSGNLNPSVSANIAIPASDYTFDDLADIYNQARVDYIVPMPMNGRRMREYVEHYDIDLNASLVAVDATDREVNGICMIGVRGERGWITRLGVIPHRRRRRTGEYLMRQLIDGAPQQGIHLLQLEVIKGNEPAIQLFEKLGFVGWRELLVVRRPPGQLDPALTSSDSSQADEIETSAIPSILTDREPNPSWIEETPSLINAGHLRGFSLSLPEGETGWIVFQRTPFQLTHFVINPTASPVMTHALLSTVHSNYPLQDTKIENIPADDPRWPVFQRFGYVEAFRRIEMALDLSQAR